jgi:hypothetical protein
VPDTPSNDGDFVQGESEPDEDVPEVEIISDDDVVSPINAARSRAAARKARDTIKNISTETQRNLKNLRQKELLLSPRSSLVPPPTLQQRAATIDPEVMTLARNYSPGRPAHLPPPTLSANRLVVDASSVYLYAADGCTTFKEMWDSALSSTRFGGPRRSAPYRELYRLTDPPAHDFSDWAENIRWAKEQKRLYGSTTWTEYDEHLERITEHRRSVWASEHALVWGP